MLKYRVLGQYTSVMVCLYLSHIMLNGKKAQEETMEPSEQSCYDCADIAVLFYYIKYYANIAVLFYYIK